MVATVSSVAISGALHYSFHYFYIPDRWTMINTGRINIQNSQKKLGAVENQVIVFTTSKLIISIPGVISSDILLQNGVTIVNNNVLYTSK